MPSVLIIGGGVIGTATAHYLNQAGCAVTIIDRGRFAGACSHANCGLISPSHVLPLAEPGMLSAGLKAMLNPASPLRIKPRLDWQFLKWLFNFGRRCNFEDMLESARGIQPLLDSSRELYDELIKVQGLTCEWQTQGCLFVYKTKEALDHFGATDKLLSEVFHAGSTLIKAHELTDFEPALKPGLAGGWFHSHDAHLRPDVLMKSWRTNLERAGVTIREQCELQDWIMTDGRVSGARTSLGTYDADHVVVATGALTPLLHKLLGVKVPIQPGKGYSITMPRPSVCPTHPMLLPEARVAVTPFDSGYRLGSIMELAGYDDTLDPKRVALLKNGARDYLHEPTAEPVVETWFGWRPMTTDSRPIIDRAPIADNVWLAAGHNMLGLSMAPATGKLASELILGKPPHLNPRPYRLDRF